MGCDVRKPVFTASEQVRPKPVCTATPISQNIEIFAWSKFDCYTFHILNNKGADQTVRMHRLVCAFVVRRQLIQVFSRQGPLKTHIILVVCLALFYLSAITCMAVDVQRREERHKFFFISTPSSFQQLIFLILSWKIRG